MSDWKHMSDDTATYKECPYGEIKNNFRYLKRDESADDDGEDVFAFHQKSSMNPGENEHSDCDSYWHNEWMEAVHKHDNSEFNNVSLFDSDPNDGSKNNISVSIGYSSASISWEFSSGGEVKKSIDGERPIWEVHEIWNDSRRQTIEHEPGSVIIMDDDVNDKRKLTELRFEGHFQNDDTSRQELSHEWYIYLDNSIQD